MELQTKKIGLTESVHLWQIERLGAAVRRDIHRALASPLFPGVEVV